MDWVYSVGCIWATIWSFMYDPFAAPGLPAWIGGVGDDAPGVFAAVLFSRFSVGACVLSLADAIAFILQLCVLAYIAGVYYAEHREPRLVDVEYREIVLWVFAGGMCVTAPILDVRFEEDVDPSLEPPMCVVSNRRLYRHLSDFNDGLVWARFSKLDLNRATRGYHRRRSVADGVMPYVGQGYQLHCPTPLHPPDIISGSYTHHLPNRGTTVEPNYSMTALQCNPSQVKSAARDNVVRVTERGTGSYVFCGEEVFEERIAREREDAAYEARLLESVGRGVADIQTGCYVTSLDEAFERAAELRRSRA